MNPRSLSSAAVLSVALVALAGSSACTSDGSGGSGASSGTGASGAGSSSCELDQWQQMMLDDHNSWRASVDPPAGDMLRVHWDHNIARNAALWISDCDPDWPHSPEDERSDIGGYNVLGENLSFCSGTGCADDPTITDGSGKGDGVGWYNEHQDYNWDDDSSTGLTSHYTQMVSANVYAIGCATKLCQPPGPAGDSEWWWTICQYGPRGQAYWSGTKPYEAGSGDLLDPPATVFDDHPGLCP